MSARSIASRVVSYRIQLLSQLTSGLDFLHVYAMGHKRISVIVIVCCAYSLYPGICSVLFSLGITSFSANHRLGLASINNASGARIFQSVRSQSVSQFVSFSSSNVVLLYVY